MSIPANIKSAVKSLLFITDVERDTDIGEAYTRALENILKKHDWFADAEYISATTGTSIYAPSSNLIRILALFYGQSLLRKSTSRSMDLVYNTWQAESNGTPQLWWQNQIPPALDALSSVSPKQFVVHPAPTMDSSGSSGFYLIGSYRPTGEDPTPTWIDPLLIYRTVAEFLRVSIEERGKDTEDEEVNVSASEFFDAIADMWEKVLEKL